MSSFREGSRSARFSSWASLSGVGAAFVPSLLGGGKAHRRTEALILTRRGLHYFTEWRYAYWESNTGKIDGILFSVFQTRLSK